jgi:hypothetical protein
MYKNPQVTIDIYYAVYDLGRIFSANARDAHFPALSAKISAGSLCSIV